MYKLKRIIGLDRYSEDLDFSLLSVDLHFSLDSYLEGVRTEFSAVGMTVSVKEKDKALVLESIIPQNGLDQTANVKIKLEVDTSPPLGFETEEKLLLQPFSFYVKCFTLSSLFAGKMHAFLFRKWKNNVKGRDWYDLEWYIKKGVPLNLHHFLLRARDSGDWHKPDISEAELTQLLMSRIDSVDFNRVIADISRFIPQPQKLNLWSPKYFRDLVQHLKIDRT